MKTQVKKYLWIWSIRIWNNVWLIKYISNNVFHQNMAAEINDLDLYLREEAFMYDRNTKTNLDLL